MQTEVEKRTSTKQYIRATGGVVLHNILRGITSLPFEMRALLAPKGELIASDGTIIAEGKVVHFSGDTMVVATQEWIYFPNPLIGDQVKKLHTK